MTANELIAQLQEKGVDLKSSGDRLVIDAPKGTITPEVRNALAEHKAELLVILSRPAAPVAPAAPEAPAAPQPYIATQPPAAPKLIETPVERAPVPEPRP